MRAHHLGRVGGGEVGAVGKELEVRGEKFLGDIGVDLDEEAFEFGDDDAGGVVGEAAVAGVVAVLAVPVAVFIFGLVVGRGVGEGEGEETCC